jgi:hypothetical protein
MERSTLQRIAVVESWDDVEEAAWVAKRVGEYAVTAAGHRPLDRVAVLVRFPHHFQTSFLRTRIHRFSKVGSEFVHPSPCSARRS